ncbi:aspartyl/asparaginyl beta-hydroxylase domain-containing protein [Streptomyces sp. NPDC050549]|uniref:aspartyl/asparaginyl beta-hydroxylase domain-containing protein n=1 Tax=Streptomyces sp. NPDC050549 TaxID=3155406 RepID=UPI00343A4684
MDTIPDGRDITVTGQTRTWREGHCLLFGHSFEREARNAGNRPRTCLLIGLWHPEATLPERQALVVPSWTNSPRSPWSCLSPPHF